jgi:hypothetical protein
MDPLTRPSIVPNHEDKDRDGHQGMHKPSERPASLSMRTRAKAVTIKWT